MPQPPRKPQKPMPSGDRLKQMLTANMMGARPNTNMGDDNAPDSLREAAMQNYPYNPSDYTREELSQYKNMLMRNQSSVFPSRTDVPGEFYNDMFHTKEYHPGGEMYARQDSLYTAQKLKDAEDARRSAMISDLMKSLGSIPGLQVRRER